MRAQFTLLSSGLRALPKSNVQEKLQYLESPAIQLFLSQIMRFSAITAEETKKLQASLSLMRAMLNEIRNIELADRIVKLQKVISTCATQFNLSIEPAKLPVLESKAKPVPVVSPVLPNVPNTTLPASTIAVSAVPKGSASTPAVHNSTKVSVTSTKSVVSQSSNLTAVGSVSYPPFNTSSSIFSSTSSKGTKEKLRQTSSAVVGQPTLELRLKNALSLTLLAESSAALNAILSEMKSLQQLASVAALFISSAELSFVRKSKDKSKDSLFYQAFGQLKDAIRSVNSEIKNPESISSQDKENLETLLKTHRVKSTGGVYNWFARTNSQSTMLSLFSCNRLNVRVDRNAASTSGKSS